MRYSLPTGSDIGNKLKQIARSQLERALAETELADGEKATHQIRKRGKKMRALVRLIRTTDPASESLYQFENAHYRSVNDLLSGSRDATSLYQALVQQLQAEDFPQMAAYLKARIPQATGNELFEARNLLQRGRLHIDDWKVDQLTWKDLRRGYRKSYRRACKALKKARKNEDDQSFHTLRKRVKDQWYHSRLLQKRYPKKIGKRCKSLNTLAGDLGDWRDLRLLCHFLARNSANLDPEVRAELIPLLDRAQQRLQILRKDIDRHCQQLFARKTWRKQKKWQTAVE